MRASCCCCCCRSNAVCVHIMKERKKSRLTCVRSVWVEMLSLFLLLLLLFLNLLSLYISTPAWSSNLAIFFQGRVARQVQGTTPGPFCLSPPPYLPTSPLLFYYSILRLLLDTTTTTTSKGKHLFRFYYPSKWPPGISPLGQHAKRVITQSAPTTSDSCTTLPIYICKVCRILYSASLKAKETGVKEEGGERNFNRSTGNDPPHLNRKGLYMYSPSSSFFPNSSTLIV